LQASAAITATTFGDLLRRLRKRAGMTQDDLAAATGYSRSLIGALERNDRLPNVELVVETYLPALGLQDEPHLAAQLVQLAAEARGERPPPALPFTAARAQVTEAAELCIPVPPTGILGRDEEIHHLCNRLLGGRGRMLTLVGPPGVGKTRLAQAVGIELQRFYRDGACFVPLAAVSDPQLVASTLASALKMYEGSVKPSQTRLIEHLRRKEMLLVLDNFEQLLGGDAAAAGLIAELLAECPGLCLLVTSRERLHLRAEQRYHVEPLGLPAAVELFVERCSAVSAGFALTDENRPVIEAICEQLDRLPLALELCAAQIDLLSPVRLLAHLQDRPFELLVNGAQDLPRRQRTLHNAIAHSYGLLDEDEARLFRSLGVFAGGCDLEAIEAVSGWGQPRQPSVGGEDLVRGAPPGAKTLSDGRTGGQPRQPSVGGEDLVRGAPPGAKTLSDGRTGGQPRQPSVGGEDLVRGAPPGAKTLSDGRTGGQEQTGRPLLQTLHGLVSKSLVRAETTPGGADRYLLLETIREYALERARADGEEGLLRHRHYIAYLQLCRRGDAGLRGPEATDWMARLEPEQDNLRAALQWALHGGRYEDAAWLMLAAEEFWYQIGRWHEAVRWIAHLLPHREALSAEQHLALLINLYLASRTPEDIEQLRPFRDELMVLTEVCPEKTLRAAAWGEMACQSASLAEASAAWERSIAFGRAAREEAGLPPSLPAAPQSLPAPLRGSSRGRPARELSKSETRSAGLGPEFGFVADRDAVLAGPLWAYAEILIEHGEFERAAPLLEESARVSQARGNRFSMADIMGVTGRAALLQGDIERARALLLEAVRVGEALHHHNVLAAFQSILGLAALYSGDVPEARRLLAGSLRICLDLGDEWYLGRVCTYLVEAALWEGKLEEAERWLAQSLTYRAHRPLIRMDKIERATVAARLAAAQGAHLRAATLFGLADELRARIHYELAGPACQLAEAALARVRAALDPTSFAEAFAAGQQLSLEEALGIIPAPGSAADASPALPK
jgi:predicted ATPase/DNA-binding XRE family transcriptional regulator